MSVTAERDLRRWCKLANRAGRQVCGYRNSCVVTSHALAAFLRDRGIPAELVRTEVHTWTGDRSVTSFSLGSSGDGSRRPATEPGMWRGHLAVTTGTHLLDPTLDQAAASNGARLRPAVFVIPSGWDGSGQETCRWADGTAYCWEEAGLSVRYGKYYRQIGWKSSPAARRIHWAEITAAMERSTRT